MPNAERNQKLAQWHALQAYCRSGRAEPLVWDSSISACICDDVPLGDRLLILGRYLLTSLARWIPLSPAKVWLLRRAGMRIGRDVYISPGVVVDPLFPELITLEDDVLLGMGCRLFTHEYSATAFRLGRIRVGRGAVIGGWALVRSGVSVGAGATVGACSFVNRDVAAGATVVGVPARPLEARQPAGEGRP
jgi:acetyltransferase-like isoleucine patch superfamily enzyme